MLIRSGNNRELGVKALGSERVNVFSQNSYGKYYIFMNL